MLDMTTRVDMPVALCVAYQRDQRNASQSCGASLRLATPRNASQRLATNLSRARYAQRPERDSTGGKRNDSHAMHRRHHARQTYEIAAACTFQSTTQSKAHGGWPLMKGAGFHERIPIHNYACAHTYTCPMFTTPPGSVKLTYTAKERCFSAHA